MTRPICALLALLCCALPARADDPWVVYPGGDGAGKGKHIILVSGDEEYRSEECLPQLGKILATRHGFKCTVLFPIDDKGEINPKHTSNISGLEALGSADLMIILTRFRNLPDAQMKHIDDFLKAGKPVIGLRTATHAFNGIKGDFAKYNNGYKGPEKEWTDGFGRLILGEMWISHHGAHKGESTIGIFAPDAAGNPLLNGIKDGEIWGATDVYGVRLPLPGDSKPLVLGQVSKRAANATKEEIAKDKNYMLRPNDIKVEGKKNDPMMPVAWTKSYTVPGGKEGKAFATTMGSATDIENEALRRLIVNAAYQLVGLSVPEKADVGIVGVYEPSAFGFGGYKTGLKPADYQLK
ncbi:hypothetical protein IPV69_11560 [Humisphaera borealis]|uniref:ThuA-like domain-containing protein n=2 Tax=Humisphaera borealis TaxID=2807512 RepID=A0A7M2X3Q9_9BACT|nr:hypothetical protein IPV69_11560 [Humisphaera borealis]